ncbi:MAG: hypothetical protein FJ028_10000, partial [Chloroflexi bacterium]|nr:hypothetical protein [Chloroflexota bacterium]
MTRRPRTVGEVARALWRRVDLRRTFTTDLPLKGAAVGVAILLFLWATLVYNAPAPDVTELFDGRIPVERPEVPPGFVMRAPRGDAQVRLRGPAD